jgi:hypothetical protein
VPRHRVAAVAVVAAARGHERLAELVGVVRGQRLARLDQGRVRQRVADAVVVQEPRHVDHVVVHRSLLGPPRDVA